MQTSIVGAVPAVVVAVVVVVVVVVVACGENIT